MEGYWERLSLPESIYQWIALSQCSIQALGSGFEVVQKSSRNHDFRLYSLSLDLLVSALVSFWWISLDLGLLIVLFCWNFRFSIFQFSFFYFSFLLLLVL